MIFIKMCWRGFKKIPITLALTKLEIIIYHHDLFFCNIVKLCVHFVLMYGSKWTQTDRSFFLSFANKLDLKEN